VAAASFRPMEAAVVHVEVEPEGAETVRVSWQTTVPVAVDVATGVRPDAVDHAHAATVPAGTTSVVLPRQAVATYASVAPHGAGPAVVAGARRLGFEGVQNFRDLGGYRVAGGGRTRWGRLFRADSLHKLTAADQHAFDQLGLRVVVDLRGDRERETHPNPIAHAVQVAVTGRPPAADDRTTDADARERAEFAASLDGERVLRDLYVGMLEHSPALFHRIFSSFAGRHGLPAVFHCHAGKDRTGVVAAITLLALGVSEADVLDDYVLTRRYWGPENQRDSFANMLDMGMSPEAAAGVLGAPRWAMEDMLGALDARYGGAEAYLTTTVGLSAAELDTLRAALVD
jgi:protein-tyrosine phosphatase